MSISGISGAGGSWLVNATSTSATVATSQQAGPFADLGLTQAQQQKISQILQNAQSQGLSPSQVQTQINAVLTPQQQQKLQSEIGQHRHHHHGSDSGLSSAGQSQTDEFGIPTSISSGSSGATQAISDIAASFWSQSQQQQQTDS